LTFLPFYAEPFKISEKAKAIVRWRRKATGLRSDEIAGLPKSEAARFFYFWRKEVGKLRSVVLLSGFEETGVLSQKPRKAISYHLDGGGEAWRVGKVLDPVPGPPSNNTGNRNQNIYADMLFVAL
jgi:hypothetical protein